MPNVLFSIKVKKFMRTFSKADLPGFIAKVDALGGPSSAKAMEYWQGMRYRPQMKVNEDLDPFSEAYVEQQLALYHEISGRAIDQETNEQSDFNIDHHVAGANAYGMTNPNSMVRHYLRLSHLIAVADLPAGAKVLDMGAGWGMSSEFFATLGCRVTSVDINPSFVQLIRRRQLRHGLPIVAEQGTFDEFSSLDRFDAVLFYECLHHAIRPWTVIERLGKMLKPNGAIIFAGEPINNMWRHWGLRNDPKSIYCIAKMGWFESGWSEAFITACLQRADLSVKIEASSVPTVGHLCVARARPNASQPAVVAQPSSQQIGSFDLTRSLARDDEWFIAPEHLIAKARSTLDVQSPTDGATLVLGIENYRRTSIKLRVERNGTTVQTLALTDRKTEVRVPLTAGANAICFVSDTWVPKLELGNADTRAIAFHLAAAHIEA